MASDVVIRAEGVGKKYVIGHQSTERYTALRDVIARSARGFARTAADMLRGRPIYSSDELEEFWALKDVSFEIRRGDVVGIIGRNGAGKSTLLKVLSRITEPSEGRVEIRGRVASLLEVGTGFHPELSGRENIYLNGAILGMTRAEIQRKFNEIVDFSGVEKFLDTPVKRYSSGMYVRLAFAVAAHLEPEILVVDEVLAVGDAEFQRKCLGKMRDVAGDGRTVLFVSHNMAAVRHLCSSGVMLRDGQIVAEGLIQDVLRFYGKTIEATSLSADLSKRADRRGDGSARISFVEIFSDTGDLTVGSKCTVRVKIDSLSAAGHTVHKVWALLRTAGGDDALMLMDVGPPNILMRNSIVWSCNFFSSLTPGTYSLACGILSDSIVDWVDDALVFDIEPVFASGEPWDMRLGLVSQEVRWRVESCSDE